jgi:hypothetical protein
MSMKGIFKTLFRLLPEPFRKGFWRIKNLVVEHGKILRTWVSPSVCLFRGVEITGGEALSFLYCGDDLQYRNYIAQLAFGSTGERKDLCRMPIWRVGKALRGRDMSVNAAWVEWNPLSNLAVRTGHAIKMPRWVEAWLDIPDSVAELRRKPGFKDIMRRIRKQGYTYAVTKDKELYDLFYYRMYEPSIRAIHGDLAYIISYSFFQRIYDCSDLLLLEQDGDYVGGVLLQYENGDAMVAYLGLKDGERSFIKDGAVGAMDYFAAEWLKRQGHCTVSLGGSKSFLNDRVLRTKMLRDCYIGMPKHIRDENLTFLALADSPGLRDFLLNNPFVRYTDEGKIEAVLFADPPAVGDEVAAEAVVSPYLKYKGIDVWQIYTLADEATEVRHIVGPNTGARITVAPFRTD